MGNLCCIICPFFEWFVERPLGKKKPRGGQPPENEASIQEAEVRNNNKSKTSGCSSPQSEKPPVIRTPNEVTLTFDNDVKAAPPSTSGWDLYEVLRQHRIKEVDDNGVAPIVKAAKAIVEINVFLASQVIYPAYLRYLEEDFPEIYTQCFERPDSPTPPYNSDSDIQNYDTENQGSSPEQASPVKRVQMGGVVINNHCSHSGPGSPG